MFSSDGTQLRDRGRRPARNQVTTRSQRWGIQIIGGLIPLLMGVMIGKDAKAANKYIEYQMTPNQQGIGYFFGLGAYILPGTPYLKYLGSTGFQARPQFSATRILVGLCRNASTGNPETCSYGDTNDTSNHKWVEIGIGTFQWDWDQGVCSPQVYTYCGNCFEDPDESWLFPTNVNILTTNNVSLWWVPNSSIVTNTTLGTWYFAFRYQVIRKVPNMLQGVRIYSGGETTLVGHEMGITHVLLNQYAYRESPTSSPSWFLWRRTGPNETNPSRYKKTEFGVANYELRSDWHGVATPTMIPTMNAQCPAPTLVATPTPE